MLFHTALLCGYRPEASVTRAGMQIGVVVMHWVKRTPSRAIRSKVGVLTQSALQPMASQRCWSVITKRMLGLVIVVGYA